MTDTISISICPTAMEFSNGDCYCETALLDAIREFITQRHPNAIITCLQVGHRQGDGWARVNNDNEAGDDLMCAFWDGCGTDERLFGADSPQQ